MRTFRQIARDMGRQWLEDWQPGKSLPTYLEMQRQQGCAIKTFQQAMGVLIDQGWVTARPKAGTRLAALPPCQSRIALVLPGSVENDNYATWRHTRRFEAFRLAAEQFNQAGGPLRVELFLEAGSDFGPGPGWPRLARDIEDEALYGVIWGFPPYHMLDDPLLRDPPIPTVFHNREYCRPARWNASVQDRDSFWDTMARWLLRNGFERTAVVGSDTHEVGRSRALLEATGLTIPPGWLLGCNPHQPAWLGETMRGLFDGPARERPRAVMVTDDHLFERVAEELEACGAAATLVGLWNHPVPCGVRYPAWLCRVNTCRWLAKAVERLVEFRTTGTVSERNTLLSPDEDLTPLNQDGRVLDGLSAGVSG